MTQNDALMTRARRVDPMPTNPFEGFADSPEAEEILTGVLEAPAVAGDRNGSVRVRKPRQGPNLGSIARRTVAVGVATVVVLGIATFAPSERPPTDGAPRSNAELVSIAESSPRYLIHQEQWTIARVYEFRSDYGEMIFVKGPDAESVDAPPGRYWMSLNWYPSHMHEGYVADRRRGAIRSWDITIAGHDALLFESNPTSLGSTFYALWREGEHHMELRSDVLPTAEVFREIAATLEPVDVDTWLSAMPENVVKPQQRPEAVDKILARLPVPAGLDLEQLRQSGMVMQDYALESEVRAAVICGWMHQWVDATKNGDRRAAKQAVDAVAWSGWSKEDDQGQGSSFVSDVAAAMKDNAPLSGNESVGVVVSYQRQLDCPEG